MPVPTASSASPQGMFAAFYTAKQLELLVRAGLEEVLRPLGVSVWQYTALSVLERRDGLTSAALARRSFVTAQTMGDVVISLERRRLIARSPDPDHRKRLTIVLTEEGRQLLAATAADVRALERRMTRGMTEDEADTLVTLMRRCIRNLSSPIDEATEVTAAPTEAKAAARATRRKSA